MNKSPSSHLAEHQAEHKLMETKGYGYIAQFLFSQRPTALAFGKGYALITDIVTTNVATNVDLLWGLYAKIPAGTEATDYLLLDHLSVEATLIP
jgi:hypothetical protein